MYELNTSLKDKLSQQIKLFDQYVTVAKRQENSWELGVEILDLFIR